MTPPFELKNPVTSHIFTVNCTIRLCPLNFARVPLHLEVLVTLGPAKTEQLRVVAHEANPMARIDC